MEEQSIRKEKREREKRASEVKRRSRDESSSTLQRQGGD